MDERFADPAECLAVLTTGQAPQRSAPVGQAAKRAILPALQYDAASRVDGQERSRPGRSSSHPPIALSSFSNNFRSRNAPNARPAQITAPSPAKVLGLLSFVP